MLSPSLTAALTALRRHWLLVLIPAVLAATVAAFMSAQSAPMYTATAVIDIETTVFTRIPTLTGPDRLLRAFRTSEYYARVAEKVGSIDAAGVQQGLNSYSVGQPAQELRITFTTSDEGIAEPAARAAAEVAMAEAKAFNAVERNRNQVVADGAEKAIEALYVEPVDTAWERADLATKEFTLLANKANADYMLELIDEAYTLRPSVPVAEAARQRGMIEYGLGGGALGLALGVLLALVRDRFGAKA